jgi:transcriptional regulator with XRE-family HTH domain
MVQPATIGERLKALRQAAGLSQQALAVAAGLSTSAVFQIEQGQKADPRFSTVAALAKALGVSLDEFAAAAGQAEAPAAPKKTTGTRRKKT